MKVIVACLVVFVAGVWAEEKCQHPLVSMTSNEWRDMRPDCKTAMRDHVKEEIGAALQYLAMGAHFARDTVNRPGFADLFFKAASEEREHAMKFIEYLLMRGELTKDVGTLLNGSFAPKVRRWTDGLEALEQALELEASVTKKIRRVIQICETDATFNDYHLVDHLTGEFLEEQYRGQRDLAGKFSTLKKMNGKHGALGEFLFDKQLLG